MKIDTEAQTNPIRVCTGNNRWENKRDGGIPLPDQTCQQRNPRTIENIVCKLYWQLSIRCWGTCQRHWHNIPHQTLRYVGRPKRDLWLHCVNFCPQKEEPYQIRLTVGGNIINYSGYVGTPISDILAYKLIFDSVLSMLYTKFIVVHI